MLDRGFLSCWNLDDLESKLGGFRFEVFDLLLAVLGLVERRSSIHIFHSVAQDAVDQTSLAAMALIATGVSSLLLRRRKCAPR